MIEVAAAWRIGVAGALFVVFALLEWVWPDRPRVASRVKRWAANAVLFFTGAAILRIVAPLGLVGAALWAQTQGIGVFAVMGAPEWITFVATLIILDCALYWQHRAMHQVSWLWRLHAPHHADPDLDVTTGVRFHPGEFIVSFAYKLALVVALGAPVWAVLVFEIALNSFSKFTHANIAWPPFLEQRLRTIVITPRAHRLHHEAEAGMHSGNYGFSILAWDMLFGTHVQRPEPKTLGIKGVDATVGADALKSLTLPFQSKLG
jgi:sterol desaturase/sphingolipid hydroxylase (fatty acid hydroxylase superfamily)